MYPGTHAATTPDKPALIMAGSGRTLTYGQLEDRSIRLSRALHDQGLRKGDVVALISDNTPETYEVYWAALRSGLYITAINHNLSPDEVAYILADCGAKAVVVSANKAELLAALADRDELTSIDYRLAYGGAVEGYADYETALAGASSEPLEDQPHGEDLLYSSGTTGRPKGIKLPLPDFQIDDPQYMYPIIFGTLYGYDTETVYLSPAPVYHAAPVRFGGAIHSNGGTLVMMEKYDPEQFLAAVEKYQVTHTQMVPTMFVRLLKLSEEQRTAHDLSTLRSVVHAAAPCPVEVKHKMIDWLGPILFEYYASTEANGATMIDSATWLEHPGSVGKPLLGEPHIVDESGKELPAGEIGTIYFDTGAEPFTYHNDDERTAATRHPEHPQWSTVGDIGYLDEDGFLYLTDRKAFIIISGGVNIYPQEIENCYTLHPKVADIAVIGEADDEMGERVVAFVQPAEGVAPDDALAAELREFGRERIAHFKVPAEFRFRSELPRTPTGKMVKGKLR